MHLLVAPTEQTIHKLLPDLADTWKISALPEKHGCDLLSLTPIGVLGFQRKTLPDLVASLHDGRLYYELDQITTSATLTHSYLIIESTLARTTDNQLLDAQISLDVLRFLIAKFGARGVTYLPTSNPTDTINTVLSISKYVTSPKFSLTARTKQLHNQWGTISSDAYSLFLLQSFPGIGPTTARAILDHFHSAPIAWTVTAAELAAVPGIGRKTAERLIAALAPASTPVAATA